MVLVMCSFYIKGRCMWYKCFYALFPCIKNKSFLKKSGLIWGFHDGNKHISAFVVYLLLHLDQLIGNEGHMGVSPRH